MFKRLSLILVAIVATSQMAAAASWYGPVIGGYSNFGYPGGGYYGGYYNSYHSSYFHYTAPTYQAPAVTYRRVPVYIFVPKTRTNVIIEKRITSPCDACQN